MSKSLLLRIGVFVAVVAAVVGYRVFFADSDEVREFNDTLVDMVSQADSRFKPFMEHLRRYSEGQEVTVELAAKARDELEKSIRGDRDLLKRIEMPDDELCREFHGGCVEYVENSLQLVEKYKEVIDYMSEHNPGAEADVDAVDALIADLIDKDEKLFDVVAQRQKRLAEKFGFELK